MLDELIFHHLGIAVFDIDATAQIYQQAGYTKTETKYDPLQNVYICFLSKPNMPMIELLAPKDETSPVCKTLERSGVTPYHNCYEVDDVEDAVVKLRRMGYILVKRPEIATAICNRKVCFLYNKNIGLIELLEK